VFPDADAATGQGYSATRVTREQFERLAQDDKLRGSLGFKALQDIITTVDTSPNRLASLQQHISINADFAMFVNRVIGLLSEGAPPTEAGT
jgi:hypothetical protein